MGLEIQVIKANKNEKEKQRVAAYARVSTEHDEQADSLENQIRYYEDYIAANPDYTFAGIYHDFGISGFKEKRPGFQKMMVDARAGKIDLIITKSITRFARNTDTVLKATRELKEMGIGVFFELQNILTTTAEGELLLTLYAALTIYQLAFKAIFVSRFCPHPHSNYLMKQYDIPSLRVIRHSDVTEKCWANGYNSTLILSVPVTDHLELHTH